MGSYFDVDMGAMQSLIESLSSSTRMMEQALDAMRDTGIKTVGTHELDSAADTFQDTWRYGLGQLKDAANDTRDKLKASYDSYDTVESALSEAFQKMTSG